MFFVKQWQRHHGPSCGRQQNGNSSSQWWRIEPEMIIKRVVDISYIIYIWFSCLFITYKIPQGNNIVFLALLTCVNVHCPATSLVPNQAHQGILFKAIKAEQVNKHEESLLDLNPGFLNVLFPSSKIYFQSSNKNLPFPCHSSLLHSS